jgi:nitrite reductase/ring-hydroxylating ferredoxin subunit
MRVTTPVERIERIRSLDPVAEKVGNLASKLLKGRRKDLLSGTWLGHPLHPLLTDVTIGAWTSAWLLDLLGGPDAEPAADALIGLGVVSAIPTAASGLSDFVDTWDKERRVGLVHAATNIGAVAAYAMSYFARRAGRRRAGVLMSFAGAALASAAGHLGGHLVFARGIGVNQNPPDERPADWTEVMRAEALSEGKPVRVMAGTAPIVLCRRGGNLYALSDRCSHRAGPLHEGDVDDGTITCPWHGSRFRLENGDIVNGPASVPQPAYEVRERDGQIEVKGRD